jgi:hypothetical protein
MRRLRSTGVLPQTLPPSKVDKAAAGARTYDVISLCSSVVIDGSGTCSGSEEIDRELRHGRFTMRTVLRYLVGLVLGGGDSAFSVSDC